MTFDQLDFATYCIGLLADRLNLNPREVYDKLKRTGILDNYVIGAYDPLHTFSGDYIAEDLTDLMRQKGVLG